MDEQVLLDNLRTNTSPFDSGQEVVYFLITARKIIENENSASNYKTLWIYSNWIAHCKLDKESSTKFISSLLSPDLTLDKSREDILNNIKRNVDSIFNFKKLKSDIKKFIINKNVSADPSVNWNSFCKHFLKEVNTSKIEFDLSIPIAVTIECENSSRHKYAISLNNKRIGSIILKYR